MSAVKPIPEGFHSVTPYLIIKDAAKAMDFYKQAFDAVELMRINGPGGSIAHGEIRIGNSPLMMGEEMPEMQHRGPLSLGGTSVSLMIYVEDVDAFFNRAVSAGAIVERPVADQFYGDRSGTLRDPFGHVWHVATHKEDMPVEEMQRRATEMYAGAG